MKKGLIWKNWDQGRTLEEEGVIIIYYLLSIRVEEWALKKKYL